MSVAHPSPPDAPGAEPTRRAAPELREPPDQAPGAEQPADHDDTVHDHVIERFLALLGQALSTLDGGTPAGDPVSFADARQSVRHLDRFNELMTRLDRICYTWESIRASRSPLPARWVRPAER